MSEFFFSLSDDEICRGLDIIHDSCIREEALATNDKLSCFAMDMELQRLAMLWLNNEKDMVLTKLMI